MTRRQLEIFESPQKAREIEQALSLFIYNLVDDHLSGLPIANGSDRTALSVPLHALLHKPDEAIQLGTFDYLRHFPEGSQK